MRKISLKQHFIWLSSTGSEILDNCLVSSLENPRKKIEAYIRKEYRSPVEIHRIIDEKKVLQCPINLIWDSYLRQESQGRCTYCGYKFVNYLGKEKNKPENFKYCLGFGETRIQRRLREELVIIYECPKCFEKSQCHVNYDWLYRYGEWIVNNSIFLKESQNER